MGCGMWKIEIECTVLAYSADDSPHVEMGLGPEVVEKGNNNHDRLSLAEIPVRLLHSSPWTSGILKRVPGGLWTMASGSSYFDSLPQSSNGLSEVLVSLKKEHIQLQLPQLKKPLDCRTWLLSVSLMLQTYLEQSPVSRWLWLHPRVQVFGFLF